MCRRGFGIFTSFTAFHILICLKTSVDFIIGSYRVSTLTTLEKRFGFSTRQLGVLLSANDFVYLPTVIFIAYFANLINRVRVIAVFGVLYSLSAVAMLIPYAVFGPKYTVPQLEVLNEVNVNSTLDVKGMCLPRLGAAGRINDTIADGRSVHQYESEITFGIMLVAGMFEGIASTPNWNIVFAFIDDLCGSSSGPYIGAVIIVRMLGPVCGFTFGSFVLRYHETLGMHVSEFALGEKNTHWIGAWWFGSVLGFVGLAIGLVMLLFKSDLKFKESGEPNFLLRLCRRNNGADDKEALQKLSERRSQRRAASLMHPDEIENPGRFNIRGLLTALKGALCNPIFLAIMFSNLLEFFAINGFIGFFPKLLQNYFRVSASQASILTGIAMPASFVVGTSISSAVSRFIHLSLPQMALWNFVANIGAVVVVSGGFFFQCEQSTFNHIPRGRTFKPACNITACLDCKSKLYNPVCISGNNYYNPCQAGCSKQLNATAFSDCACFPDVPATRTGICETTCTSVYAYIALFTLFQIMRHSSRVQEMLLVMRCLRPSEKSVGMGIMSTQWSIAAFTVPMVMGSLIDSSCLMQPFSRLRKTFCLLYDMVKYKNYFLGYATGVQIPSTLLLLLVFILTRRRYGSRKKERSGGDERKAVDVEEMKMIET